LLVCLVRVSRWNHLPCLCGSVYVRAVYTYGRKVLGRFYVTAGKNSATSSTTSTLLTERTRLRAAYKESGPTGWARLLFKLQREQAIVSLKARNSSRMILLLYVTGDESVYQQTDQNFNIKCMSGYLLLKRELIDRYPRLIFASTSHDSSI
jgi:hypothetical protein